MKGVLMTILKTDSYWRSVIRLAFLFTLVLCFMEFTFKCGFNVQCFKEGIIDRGMLFIYLRKRILIGVAYGLVMSFIFHRRKLKQTNY